MVAEWQILTLREAGVSLIDCEHKTPPASDSGYPYIAIPQLKHGRIDLSDARHITREHLIDWTRKAKPKEHDVILSRRCNPGETAFVPPGLECALGQNLVLLQADGSKVTPEFLRWLVRGPEWWEQIGKFINVGAVFDSLRCADIPNLELTIPTLSEQRAIAHILGTLDDKIELNCKMNQTLEAMARAIFKSWFVDFDPVRARAEGRDSGLPPDLAALFPDSFEDSELGEIPKGWRVQQLGDLIELAYGKALKEENRQLGNVPVFGSNGQVGTHNEKLVTGPGIVVGRKGNPGIVTWAPSDFFPIDTTFYVVTKDMCRSLYFLFLALQDQDLAALGADSAVPGLNRNMAYMSQLIVPDASLLDVFDKMVQPIFERISHNDEGSRTLAALREVLLQKLLSGEIRVSSNSR